MTTAPAAPAAAPRARPDPDATPRALLAGAALSLAIWLVFLAASGLDDRSFLGAPVWAKPQKFALSLAVHLATLGWILARLSPETRARRSLAALAAAALLCGWFELAWIGIQAGRAAPSHYNAADAFGGLMYTLMGLGAVVLVLLAAEIGRLAARDAGARLGPGLREGVVLGLIGGAAGTILLGGFLGSGAGHHWPEQLPDGRTLPLLGWSAETGDLRPPHFISSHAMQALPLLGLAADRLGLPAPRAAVRAGAAALLLAALGALALALAGRPLIAL